MPNRTTPVRTLVAGSASGSALVLERSLSLWGGLDPVTGRITDRRHPQHGERVAGRILVMVSGKGSSSSSSVLAEAVRLGQAPAAIVLREPDPILTIGALVAFELYAHAPPIVVVASDAFTAIRTGDRVRVSPSGLDVGA